MKKLLLITLLILSSVGVASAQGISATFHVVDAITQNPIAGATVRINNTTLGAVTDTDGYASF